MRVDSDSEAEEVSDDDKGYFSDTGTKPIRRWGSKQPPQPSPSQSSPDKSVDDVGAKMEFSSPSHISTASKEETETGLDDVSTNGKRKKGERKTSSVTSRRKMEGKTSTSSPANNTRAQKFIK